jgi:hypothetical protein
MLDVILGVIGIILGIIRGIIELLPGDRPCESLANVALLVVGVWLLWRGVNFVGLAVRGLAITIGVTVNAFFSFSGSLLRAFGTAVGGLVFLVLGGIAVWCAFLLIGGG